uniref:Uncharacterized protein n=1 Tax=Steinernema glaseri TaxID=37863 RepID=A0A1I7YXW9_9BILA
MSLTRSRRRDHNRALPRRRGGSFGQNGNLPQLPATSPEEKAGLVCFASLLSAAIRMSAIRICFVSEGTYPSVDDSRFHSELCRRSAVVDVSR